MAEVTGLDTGSGQNTAQDKAKALVESLFDSRKNSVLTNGISDQSKQRTMNIQRDLNSLIRINSKLRNSLQAEGMLVEGRLKVDGGFGLRTATAYRNAQRAYNLGNAEEPLSYLYSQTGEGKAIFAKGMSSSFILPIQTMFQEHIDSNPEFKATVEAEKLLLYGDKIKLDGRFGEEMKGITSAFQKSNSIAATGQFGTSTNSKLLLNLNLGGLPQENPSPRTDSNQNSTGPDKLKEPQPELRDSLTDPDSSPAETQNRQDSQKTSAALENFVTPPDTTDTSPDSGVKADGKLTEGPVDKSKGNHHIWEGLKKAAVEPWRPENIVNTLAWTAGLVGAGAAAVAAGFATPFLIGAVGLGLAVGGKGALELYKNNQLRNEAGVDTETYNALSETMGANLLDATGLVPATWSAVLLARSGRISKFVGDIRSRFSGKPGSDSPNDPQTAESETNTTSTSDELQDNINAANREIEQSKQLRAAALEDANRLSDNIEGAKIQIANARLNSNTVNEAAPTVDSSLDAKINTGHSQPATTSEEWKQYLNQANQRVANQPEVETPLTPGSQDSQKAGTGFSIDDFIQGRPVVKRNESLEKPPAAPSVANRTDELLAQAQANIKKGDDLVAQENRRHADFERAETDRLNQEADAAIEKAEALTERHKKLHENFLEDQATKNQRIEAEDTERAARAAEHEQKLQQEIEATDARLQAKTAESKARTEAQKAALDVQRTKEAEQLARIEDQLAKLQAIPDRVDNFLESLTAKTTAPDINTPASPKSKVGKNTQDAPNLLTDKRSQAAQSPEDAAKHLQESIQNGPTSNIDDIAERLRNLKTGTTGVDDPVAELYRRVGQAPESNEALSRIQAAAGQVKPADPNSIIVPTSRPPRDPKVQKRQEALKNGEDAASVDEAAILKNLEASRASQKADQTPDQEAAILENLEEQRTSQKADQTSDEETAILKNLEEQRASDKAERTTEQQNLGNDSQTDKKTPVEISSSPKTDFQIELSKHSPELAKHLPQNRVKLWRDQLAKKNSNILKTLGEMSAKDTEIFARYVAANSKLHPNQALRNWKRQTDTIRRDFKPEKETSKPQNTAPETESIQAASTNAPENQGNYPFTLQQIQEASQNNGRPTSWDDALTLPNRNSSTNSSSDFFEETKPMIEELNKLTGQLDEVIERVADKTEFQIRLIENALKNWSGVFPEEDFGRLILLDQQGGTRFLDQFKQAFDNYSDLQKLAATSFFRAHEGAPLEKIRQWNTLTVDEQLDYLSTNTASSKSSKPKDRVPSVELGKSAGRLLNDTELSQKDRAKILELTNRPESQEAAETMTNFLRALDSADDKVMSDIARQIMGENSDVLDIARRHLDSIVTTKSKPAASGTKENSTSTESLPANQFRQIEFGPKGQALVNSNELTSAARKKLDSNINNLKNRESMAKFFTEIESATDSQLALLIERLNIPGRQVRHVIGSDWPRIENNEPLSIVGKTGREKKKPTPTQVTEGARLRDAASKLNALLPDKISARLNRRINESLKTDSALSFRENVSIFLSRVKNMNDDELKATANFLANYKGRT